MPIVVAILLAGTHLSAAAQCGLHAIPEADWDAKSPFRAGISLRRTGITHEGAVGIWSEAALEGSYRNSSVEFGVEWPLALAETRSGTHLGSGNPAATLTLFHPMGRFFTGLGGLQAAFPVPGGLAGNHIQATVFTALNGKSGAWNGTTSVGFGLLWPEMPSAGSASGHAGMHHGSGSDLHRIGHPHENREWLYRAGINREVSRHLAVGLALDGRHPLGDSGVAAAGREFLVLEPSLQTSVGRTSIASSFRFPVSPDRVVRWGMELTLSRAL